uniref:Galactose-1-phosphate uridyl transferase N-terminal domain-containing protein n=1 Tax=Physcomitrium patens TaxID=3218 RepID=A0A2K1KZN4_PHYPA|nr:hypothetical protein PHYPA_002033 [Physcomitrium patens]
MAELRQDLLRQRWIIISDKRGKRPTGYNKKSDSNSVESCTSGPCAFCPGQEQKNGHELFAIRESDEADSPDWEVRVINNKYPAVSCDFDEVLPTGEGEVYGSCRLPGFGSHEVIIETPNHQLPLPELSALHIVKVLKAYQARINYFQSDSRFKYIHVFKNRGDRAGASMTHSHSQLIALPVRTHNIQAELHGSQEYYDKHKRCLLCDVAQYETQANCIRLIDENEHFVTVSPYAPMFPFETWLWPKRHSSNYETIGEDEVNNVLYADTTVNHLFVVCGLPCATSLDDVLCAV